MRGGSDIPSNTAAKSRKPATSPGSAKPETKPAPSTPAKATAPAKSPAPPKMPGKDDRRSQLRVRSRSLANGGIAGNAARTASSFLATTVNLSIGGCLIRTYEALEPGMDVTISLKLPEGDLCTPGKIVHVNEDAVGCRMCGVRFAPLGMDSHTLLLQHIATFGGETTPPATAAPTGKSSAGATSNGKFVIEGRIHKN
jgi:hypothetical protein